MNVAHIQLVFWRDLMATKPESKRNPIPKPADTSIGRRKLPSQQRAKVTVDSIMQAAAEIISVEGFADIGTGRIAERAGVSIGSLYQYFPNYPAILLGLYEDVASKCAHRMNELAASLFHERIEVAIPKILDFLLRLYEENAVVLLRMPREVPEIARATYLFSFESMAMGATRLYVQQHHEFLLTDTARHLFFIETLGIGSLRRYAMNPPADVSREEFLTHLARIINAYLKGDLS